MKILCVIQGFFSAQAVGKKHEARLRVFLIREAVSWETRKRVEKGSSEMTPDCIAGKKPLWSSGMDGSFWQNVSQDQAEWITYANAASRTGEAAVCRGYSSKRTLRT